MNKPIIIERQHIGSILFNGMIFMFWLALATSLVFTPFYILIREVFGFDIFDGWFILIYAGITYLLAKKFTTIFIAITFIFSIGLIFYLSDWSWEKIIFGIFCTIFVHGVVLNIFNPDDRVIQFWD